MAARSKQQTATRWFSSAEPRLYLAAIGLTAAALTVMMRLWQVDWSAPFFYHKDALGSAAHFDTTLATGWYENQPRLGFPFGQHYHDFPFSDDLHLAMARVFGLFTDNWVTAFNGYYLLTFLLCAATAVWFFRVCGLRGATAVVLAVLFAVAPYHFVRNEMHLFLSGYYLIPPAMVLVLRTARGESLWGLRSGVDRARAVLTGRGAGTVVIIGLLVYDGAYYAVFFGLLLATAAAFALVRERDRRRFGGAVAAGAVLGIWYLIALLPDLLYAAVHGSNAGAFVRETDDAQLNSLRFLQLVLPAPHHPLPPFARLRQWYDTNHPPVAEHPALGLLATIGFLLLLAIGVLALIGLLRRARSRASAEGGSAVPAAVHRSATGRWATLVQLSVLTWVAFLLAAGGGARLSGLLGITAVRGWNRMSIEIALLALAGLGLMVEAAQDRFARRPAAPADARPAPSPRWLAASAAALLVIGVADQSLTSAVPEPATAATFHSDQAFFGSLQSRLPAGSAIFQLPYRPYPESGLINGTSESDQLRPFLNTSTLKWSAGGIKGRPQTNWPAAVSAEPPEQLTRDLAIIGFSGILIDRDATPDLGRSLAARLAPFTGPAQAVSSDGRWAYLSLARPLQQIAAMTPAARADRAARLTNGATQ